MVGVDSIDVAVIRSRLPEHIAVLSYRVGDDETDVFVTTREGTQTVRLAVGTDGVDRLVKDYLQALSPTRRAPGDLDSVTEAAREAWDALAAPAAPLLEGRSTVIVVPDGNLYRLPFGALHDGSGWWIERVDLVSVPSLNVADVLL